MTEREIYEGIEVLVGMQLNFSPDLSTKEKSELYLKVWYMYLAKYTKKQFQDAIYLWGKSNNVFPRPSDIMKLIPVPEKYIKPEMVFSYFLSKTHQELEKTENGRIILLAVKNAGYDRFRLSRIENTDTVERYIKPKLEKAYRELIEKDQMENDILAISGQEIKRINHRENK